MAPRRWGCSWTLRGAVWTLASQLVLSAALALSALPAYPEEPPRLLPLPACCLLPGPPGPQILLWCWPPALWVTSGSSLPVSGMSHEPKSPSLGMLSTATRTTATVNPLTPSPLNGALVPSGSPATSSALSAQAAPSSSFAAALRKLAKQAEEPRGKRRPSGRGQGRERSPAFPPELSAPARSRRQPRKQLFPMSRSGGQSAHPYAHTCSHLLLGLSLYFCAVGAAQSELRDPLDPHLASKPTQPWHLCLASASALSPISVLSWLQEPPWGHRPWGHVPSGPWVRTVDVLGHESP